MKSRLAEGKERRTKEDPKSALTKRKAKKIGVADLTKGGGEKRDEQRQKGDAIRLVYGETRT